MENIKVYLKNRINDNLFVGEISGKIINDFHLDYESKKNASIYINKWLKVRICNDFLEIFDDAGLCNGIEFEDSLIGLYTHKHINFEEIFNNGFVEYVHTLHGLYMDVTITFTLHDLSINKQNA